MGPRDCHLVSGCRLYLVPTLGDEAMKLITKMHEVPVFDLFLKDKCDLGPVDQYHMAEAMNTHLDEGISCANAGGTYSVLAPSDCGLDRFVLCFNPWGGEPQHFSAKCRTVEDLKALWPEEAFRLIESWDSETWEV